jgi:hypothetical protein
MILPIISAAFIGAPFAEAADATSVRCCLPVTLIRSPGQKAHEGCAGVPPDHRGDRLTSASFRRPACWMLGQAGHYALLAMAVPHGLSSENLRRRVAGDRRMGEAHGAAAFFSTSAARADSRNVSDSTD